MSDYDEDFLVWSELQAELLRRHAAGDRVNDAGLDWPNIAEEIEALGRRDQRELRNRIGTILLHLILLQASPAAAVWAIWQTTILTQRRGIRWLLKDSPSLRPRIPALIGEELPDAREAAALSLADHSEQPRVDIAGLAFTDAQVLGPWLP